MKKLLLLLLFIPLVSFGQKSNDADALKLCVALQSNNFTTDAEAEDAVNKILSVIGASQKPILQACSNISNAVAAVYKGQRYILYDRDFMNSLSAGSNKYWSNMFILAHEVGHHINGHSLDIILYATDVIDPKSLIEKRKQELEADEFAGFVLAKLGASLAQTSQVLLNLPMISNENTSTHPSTSKRVIAVRKGFGKSNAKTINTKTAKPKTIINKTLKKDLIPNLSVPREGFNEVGFEYKLDDYYDVLVDGLFAWERNVFYVYENDVNKTNDPFLKIKYKDTKPIKKVYSSSRPQAMGYSVENFPYSNFGFQFEQNYFLNKKKWHYVPNMEYALSFYGMNNLIGYDDKFNSYNYFVVVDLLIDENYSMQLTGKITPSAILFHDIDVNKKEQQKLLYQFIQKVKAGNNLYVRINKIFKWNGYNANKGFNTELVEEDMEKNKSTYELSLKGSSKALKF
jgi:hypothetical protein